MYTKCNCIIIINYYIYLVILDIEKKNIKKVLIIISIHLILVENNIKMLLYNRI